MDKASEFMNLDRYKNEYKLKKSDIPISLDHIIKTISIQFSRGGIQVDDTFYSQLDGYLVRQINNKLNPSEIIEVMPPVENGHIQIVLTDKYIKVKSTDELDKRSLLDILNDLCDRILSEGEYEHYFD